VIRLTFAVLTLVLLLAPAVGWAEEAAAPTPKTSEPAAKLAEPAPDAPCPASSTLFMDALGAVGAKKPLDDLGLLIYGYTEGGFTGRPSAGRTPSSPASSTPTSRTTSCTRAACFSTTRFRSRTPA